MIQSAIAFLGRALLSLIFIASGLQKIFHWQEAMGSVNQAMTDWLALSVGHTTLQNLIEMAMSHIPLLLITAVAFELIGGLFVFLGLWTRLGALLLLLCLTFTTLLFHHFWQLSGVDKEIQMIHFMKNISIAGGLLLLLSIRKNGQSAPS